MTTILIVEDELQGRTEPVHPHPAVAVRQRTRERDDEHADGGAAGDGERSDRLADTHHRRHVADAEGLEDVRAAVLGHPQSDAAEHAGQ